MGTPFLISFIITFLILPAGSPQNKTPHTCLILSKDHNYNYNAYYYSHLKLGRTQWEHKALHTETRTALTLTTLSRENQTLNFGLLDRKLQKLNIDPDLTTDENLKK